jgi:hypothetical protein
VFSIFTVYFNLSGYHVTEFLSVFTLPSEIDDHVPEVPVETVHPFVVIMTALCLSEGFLEKVQVQPFLPVVVVLP